MPLNLGNEELQQGIDPYQMIAQRIEMIQDLPRLQEAVQHEEVQQNPRLIELLSARIAKLEQGGSGAGGLGLGTDSALQELAMEGSYRNPIETAMGSRMNPITAAGLTILSAGEGMQGRPLTAVDLMKTGIQREGSIADIQARGVAASQAQRTAQIQADKEGREQNKQYFEQVNTMLNDLENADHAFGEDQPDKYAEIVKPLYDRFKKAVIGSGGTAEDAAAMFRTARENTGDLRNLLNDSFGQELAEVLPPKDVRELYAGLVKDGGKGLQNIRLGLAIRTNRLMKENGEPPAFSEQALDELRMSVGQPTSTETRTKAAQATQEEIKAETAVITQPEEHLQRRELVRKTEAETKHIIAQTSKLTQEVAAHAADPEMAKQLKAGLKGMSDGTPLAKLPEIQRMAVTKALTDQDLRTTMMEIQLYNARIHGETAFADMFRTAYAIFKNAEDTGSKEDKKLALEMMRRIGIKAITTKGMLEELMNLNPSRMTVPEPGPVRTLPKPPIPRKGAGAGSPSPSLEDLNKATKRNQK